MHWLYAEYMNFFLPINEEEKLNPLTSKLQAYVDTRCLKIFDTTVHLYTFITSPLRDN